MLHAVLLNHVHVSRLYAYTLNVDAVSYFMQLYAGCVSYFVVKEKVVLKNFT